MAESESENAQVARQLADLRLQVNALEVTAKTESLPASVKEAKSTMRWSAIVVALALIVSSIIKYCGDKRVEAFEKRIETLENRHNP